MDRRTCVAALAALPVAAAVSEALAQAGQAPGGVPTIRRLDSALDGVIAPGTVIEKIADGIQWAEGPAWVTGDPRHPDGYLVFSDPPANIMRRWVRGVGVSVALNPSGAPAFDSKLVREAGSNGVIPDGKGGVFLANSGGRTVDHVDLVSGARRVVAANWQGKAFNSPNDLVGGADGRLYFTDPPYGFAAFDASPLKQMPHNGVYLLHKGVVRVVDSTLARPNGVGLSPDGRRLYVSSSDPADSHIYAYDLDGEGMPLRRRVFLDATPLRVPGAMGNPDGMKVASNGLLFASAPSGMLILTPEAEILGVIAHGEPIANCCFGHQGRELFLTANHAVYRLDLARSMTA